MRDLLDEDAQPVGAFVFQKRHLLNIVQIQWILPKLFDPPPHLGRS